MLPTHKMGSSPTVLSLQEGQGLTIQAQGDQIAPEYSSPYPPEDLDPGLQGGAPILQGSPGPALALTNWPSSMPMTVELSASWYTSLRRQAGTASMVLLGKGEQVRPAAELLGPQRGVPLPQGLTCRAWRHRRTRSACPWRISPAGTGTEQAGTGAPAA